MTKTARHECGVIVVGGGPCGLMLANELGRRGVSVFLLDQKAGTAFNPQANATQARTMEHFRRLGFADEIRALGMPADFPTDIAYFTRYAAHELARYKLPSARAAKQAIAKLSGSWSAAELPHRVSQKFVEATLRRHAESLPDVSVNYGWRLLDFTDHGDRVEARMENVSDGSQATVHGAYLVGADGPRSQVRQHLGFRYSGEAGIRRDFFGGQMYAIYLRAPAFYEQVPHAPAWMNVTFNRERRAFMAAVDGCGEFAFHTQLRPHEQERSLKDEDALSLFQAAVGINIPAQILSCDAWTAGHALVAERLQQGRVLIAGDAAHLFTPTGGLGYNTAVDDAVNLGWKLAAVLKGYGGPQLLASYEAERRPLAERNTAYARGFADSLGLYEPVPDIEDDSPAGAAARIEAGRYLEAHARAEFNIPGITFGGRYDSSPIIVSDGSLPPPDSASEYVATACPGGRAPHLWLNGERSLYDGFGFEWTLLRLGSRAPDTAAFSAAAAHLKLPLKVTELGTEEARELYGTDLALIRPDQMVAWRGNRAEAPADIIQAVTGYR
ncbi:MAG: FAD-dependent oxidoreductase [Pseudomonadales bacterium]|nr:FAD-dependent oxidoreductase [Pseudomonadales bacterium]